MLLLLACLVLTVAPAAPLCSRKECKCNYYQTNQRVSASCHFETRQRLTLQDGDFPEELSSVDLVGGRELRFGVGVLARPRFMDRLSISNVSLVFVQKNSFANLTSATVKFEFSDSKSLILEEGSFRNLRGPASVSIRRVEHLVVHREAFTWLSDLLLSDVVRLELHDEAFHLDNPLDKLDQTPVTTITLEKVAIESIGRSTFHSSAKEIRIVNSRIEAIKTDAFDAIEIRSIVIENSTVDQIAAGAFNDRTLVVTFRLTNVTIQDIASGALPIGSSQLVIEQSTFKKINKGAINITVADVTFAGNTFGRVEWRGIHLQKWDSINIRDNKFERLDSEAFAAPLQPPLDRVTWNPECNFTGNTINQFGSSVFDFALTDDVAFTIDNNYFVFKCHCDMSSTIDRVITGIDSARWDLYTTGLCGVDKIMARCFDVPTGPMLMTNFTETFCRGPTPPCEEETQRDIAMLPPVVPAIISSTDSVLVQGELERERLIMGSVVVLCAIGMLIVLLVSIIKWISNFNYCSKARMILLTAVGPVLPRDGPAGLAPASSAHSISRLSVHEYAELQRKCEEGRRALAQVEELEDKATQTMPEELTQELLQSLREKLSDPADYREARDMLEHLYDLIKVEETRDDIRERPTLLCDYLEPRDRTLHVYSEPRAPLCDYAEPNDSSQHVYAELPNLLANRPLPSKPL